METTVKKTLKQKIEVRLAMDVEIEADDDVHLFHVWVRTSWTVPCA